jgi:hypothetical protein
MRFERARAVADAVLFEGYALYPYRASSRKNQLRWQFGVLAPRAFSEAGGGDPWWMETQTLIEPLGEPHLEARLRFLRLRRRTIHTDAGAVESMEVGGKLLVPWDEGEVHEIDIGLGERTIDLRADTHEELVRDTAVVAHVRRRRSALTVRVLVTMEEVAAPRPLLRLRARIENLTPCDDARAPRDQIIGSCCLGTHLLLSVAGGQFVSLLDPPDWAANAATACQNLRLYPVLAGAPGERDLALASPIILYDHPEVAPESAGDLFDATEIDEILTLRTRTLTEDEKRQARATDERIAALIDRVEATSPDELARLHGAFRDHLQIGAVAVGPGSRVRLRPSARRTDAQDMFVQGRIARVEKVMRDVQGKDCLAVLLEDDPAADLHLWHGRFLYFYPEEVEPLP